MNRRQLIAAGLSSLATVVSGCSGRTEQNQATEQNLSEPDEIPAWAADGTVDLDAIYTNMVAELAGGPLSFEKRLLLREQTVLPGDGTVLEERVVRLRSDGDRELGSYLSGTENDGAISGDPRTAGTVGETYYADGQAYYYYSNRGSSPSYGTDDGPFEIFVDQVAEAMVFLFDSENRIVFDEPMWDEANGVYVVRGTRIDDSNLDNDVDLNTCELQIDEAGVFSQGNAEFLINDQADGSVESILTFPETVDVSEPEWIPEDIGQLTIEVAVEDGSWQFVYGQGVVSEAELLLPANHLVELRTTGRHEYRQTFDIPELSIKLDLIPNGKRSREVFISEESVGESYKAFASELSPNSQDLTAEVKIVPQSDFEEWVENNQ